MAGSVVKSCHFPHIHILNFIPFSLQQEKPHFSNSLLRLLHILPTAQVIAHRPLLLCLANFCSNNTHHIWQFVTIAKGMVHKYHLLQSLCPA